MNRRLKVVNVTFARKSHVNRDRRSSGTIRKMVVGPRSGTLAGTLVWGEPLC
jgi:hypothetical protein